MERWIDCESAGLHKDHLHIDGSGYSNDREVERRITFSTQTPTPVFPRFSRDPANPIASDGIDDLLILITISREGRLASISKPPRYHGMVKASGEVHVN